MMALTPIARSHRVRARIFSMNLLGHRIVACLAKAALKTHALQTLTRGPLTRPRARSVWSASDLSALSVRRGTASGSISQCMCKNEKRLSGKAGWASRLPFLVRGTGGTRCPALVLSSWQVILVAMCSAEPMAKAAEEPAVTYSNPVLAGDYP